MRKSINMKELTLGVCYYPEHWDESLWTSDLDRMKECGIKVLRIAEFAWNKFEPHDGEFTFAFFDRFMDLVKEKGLKVIFCTPTATPPAWLSEANPEILNTDIDGNPIYHGMRRHYNLNSKVYKEYCGRITEKLAEHYVNHSSVIGWQLDNEINCENDQYFSKADHDAFREYCKEKYKTLDAFNKAMGTEFWNQTYTDWSEVFLRRRSNMPGYTNPHMQLEEKRFVSESVIAFFKLQADIIRKYQDKYGVKDQFITTNGIFGFIDYHKLTDDVLDFITYDNYPAFNFEDALDKDRVNGFFDRNVSFNLTKIRSISPNFGIMEEQSGAGGWNFRMKMPMPKPGQMRLWALQTIAHGADFVSFFRWRTARFGTEIYWHGLLDYDNRDNRRIAELKTLHKDFEAIKELAGSKVSTKVAVIMDYDNDWDGTQDMWHSKSRSISHDSWFRVLEEKHIGFDFVYLNCKTTLEDLSGYELLVYPHATIIDETRISVLKQYCENGGKLVFGCRSGYKNVLGQCVDLPMPGLIAELSGCTVSEYTYVSQFDEPVNITMPVATAPAPEFHEVLEPVTARVLGTFTQPVYTTVKEHYVGSPALTINDVGSGACLYLGAPFSKEMCEAILEMSSITSSSEIEAPASIELVTREKNDKKYIFVLNYLKTSETITLSRAMKELLSDSVESGDVTIDPYGVKVYSI